MYIAWLLFGLSTIVAYVGIAWFGQHSGGSSTSAVSAFFSAIRPLPLIVVTIANMFFGLALYYGFSVTRFAIPTAISLGVITSFVYSIVMLGAPLTLIKFVGVVIIIIGIAVLAL